MSVFKVFGFVIISSILLCGVASAKDKSFVPNFLSLYPSAEVFAHNKKSYQKIQLVEGVITYVEADQDETGNHDEGYKLTATHEVVGQVERYVLDHSEKDSSIEVATNLRKEMERKGFNILFSCDGIACGDVAGWRLYMSEMIEGEMNSQHYVIGAAPSIGGGEWIVSLYSNEFSGRPRTIIDIVNTEDTIFKNFSINRRLLAGALENGVVVDDLLFDFDLAELKSINFSRLDEVGSFLADNKNESVIVLGYADSLGASEYNDDLSLRRANSVKKYLLEHFSIGDVQLIVKAMGESDPKASNDNSEQRAKNRRVVIKKVKS